MNEHRNQLHRLHKDGIPKEINDNQISHRQTEEDDFVRAATSAEGPVRASAGVGIIFVLAEHGVVRLEEPLSVGVRGDVVGIDEVYERILAEVAHFFNSLCICMWGHACIVKDRKTK